MPSAQTSWPSSDVKGGIVVQVHTTFSFTDKTARPQTHAHKHTHIHTDTKLTENISNLLAHWPWGPPCNANAPSLLVFRKGRWHSLASWPTSQLPCLSVFRCWCGEKNPPTLAWTLLDGEGVTSNTTKSGGATKNRDHAHFTRSLLPISPTTPPSPPSLHPAPSFRPPQQPAVKRQNRVFLLFFLSPPVFRKITPHASIAPPFPPAHWLFRTYGRPLCFQQPTPVVWAWLFWIRVGKNDAARAAGKRAGSFFSASRAF